VTRREIVLRERIAGFDEDTQSVWGLWYDLRHLARLRIEASDTAEALELLFRADKIRDVENARAPKKKSVFSRAARVDDWARYRADLDLASDLIRSGAVDAGARLFVHTAEGRAWEEPVADAFGYLLALVEYLKDKVHFATSTPGDYAEAEIAARAALAFAEERHPSPHMDRLHALSTLYYSLVIQRKLQALLPLRERIVVESEAVYGPDTMPVANALESLAYWCQELGEHKRAADLRRRVLRIQERVHGRESWQASTAHSRLSYALDRSGLIDEAIVEAERAYEIFESKKLEHKYLGDDEIERHFRRHLDDLRARKVAS